MKHLQEYIKESKNIKLEDIYKICKKYQPKTSEFAWELGQIKRPKDRKPFDGVALKKDGKWYFAIFYIGGDGAVKLANAYDTDITIPEDKLEFVINYLSTHIHKPGGFNELDELKHYIIFGSYTKFG